MTLRPLPRTIGIIGGGQLGRMMIYRAKKLGFRFAVLDGEGAPAESLADIFIKGNLKDAKALAALAGAADVLTYEIEHVNADALQAMEGTPVFPSPATLKTIQDKLLQKRLFAEKGIPVAAFFEDAEERAKRKFPLVQKARREGYDGRGVRILQSAADAPLPVPSFFEEMVDIEKELAVMAARGADGCLAVYPVVEMAFNPEHNICDTVIAPARIDEKTAATARQIALAAVAALDGVGIFGVELFLDKQGRILLNEVAPRPHNSGHYTMEACVTCQFEQHVRAVAGLPLGDAALLRPAVMLNLLGQPGGAGQPAIEGLHEALSVPGLSLHLYGKTQARPFRKMGHFTITAATLEEALEKAQYARSVLKITGNPECARIRAGGTL
ncbi:MAG: 5-(carboxyamino)imidazole ribonucleotide synthase [Spirochaetia bacterium]|jgi:5-(carboxyamino)imidazole ribonucleotide synthase|nr:5-(carboxyamino)imidazole ribonucleotide synthase [Spirochaetia bacterium]